MTVAALVLAAGLGRRFGGDKQLADLHGRPLVTYPVGLALANSCSPVIVVVGHRGDDVATLFADVDRVSTVTNTDYARGQASSLRTGIDAIPPAAEAVLVLLGDQPYVPDVALPPASVRGRTEPRSPAPCTRTVQDIPSCSTGQSSPGSAGLRGTSEHASYWHGCQLRKWPSRRGDPRTWTLLKTSTGSGASTVQDRQSDS